ncbi:hypothetical protein O0L34_g16655 [Tuta absoluta]|nr:hypothetical protein O0L34_g16655 [Tuta absoluta]
MIKCFEESTSEAILLENISVLGFKTCNRMEVVNVKFMELAFKQIAKFHALGFVMQKKMPDYFKKKIRSMEHIYQFNDTLYAAFKPLLKITTNKLRPEIKEKVQKYQLKCLEKFEKHLKDTDSIGTLCHGDFRANNLLVKEVDGKITEVIPIDYQICHYGCPANDILLLMYGCTDQKFRKAHKIHLINLYYQHLGEFLNYFDIEVAKVYPRKEFDRALTERADYGLVIALYYYAAYFARDDDVPDITEGFTHISYDLDDEIVKRIEEIVEEYDEEENYLKKYGDIE